MSFIIPKKPQILYAPMLGSLGGGSVRGFGRGVGGGYAGPGELLRHGSSAGLTWAVPSGVESICVVSVGGGGAGEDQHDGNGGGGGALAWKNNIAVTPGQTILIQAGLGGAAEYGAVNNIRTNNAGVSGGLSRIQVSGAYYAWANGGLGGNRNYTVNTYINGATYQNADGGGRGGDTVNKSSVRTGGSGAGGYAGQGGRMGCYYYDSSFGSTAGQGGGGGGGEGLNGGVANYCSGGGGVGAYGQGADGDRSSIATSNYIGAAQGGSGGDNGVRGGGNHSGAAPSGGAYGGGGGGGHAGDWAGSGGPGVVRIIWGEGRSFPSTNVDLASSLPENRTFL